MPDAFEKLMLVKRNIVMENKMENFSIAGFVPETSASERCFFSSSDKMFSADGVIPVFQWRISVVVPIANFKTSFSMDVALNRVGCYTINRLCSKFFSVTEAEVCKFAGRSCQKAQPKQQTWKKKVFEIRSQFVSGCLRL